MARNNAGKGILALMAAISLVACGTKGSVKCAETPQEAAEYAMESLKELDMDTFNACTDNLVKVHRNFFGLPVRKEYRVFHELQQPGLFKTREYRWNHAFAKKLMEGLDWEIKEIREEGDRAEITMEISNLDMAEVMGRYMVSLLEGMVESEGMGLGSLLKDITHIRQYKSGLLEIMESTEPGVHREEVTVLAYREEDGWKLGLSEEFINAFMGNMNAENCSEELEQRIEELENQYEEKIEAWAENLEEALGE